MAQNPRTQSRMLALQAACVFDAVGEAFTPDVAVVLADEELHAELGFEQPPTEETVRFARELALGLFAARAQIDARLTAAATNWSLERMTPVDRNVLRLGAYELLERPDTPHAVVLDEAVELARRFGDQNSPAFVNGVLDAVRRAITGSTPVAAPAAPPAPADTPAEPTN